MATTGSSKRKLLVSVALIAVLGVGAYSFARVYPPRGPVEGTIAPSQRYAAPQVGAADVTLGDQSVAQLMQTDAFEAIIKDPNFRKLARDPNFARLAQNPKALVDFARNSDAFKALGHDPNFLAVMNNPSFSAAVKSQSFAKAMDQTDASAAARGHSLNGRSASGYLTDAEPGSGQVAYVELPRHR